MMLCARGIVCSTWYTKDAFDSTSESEQTWANGEQALHDNAREEAWPKVGLAWDRLGWMIPADASVQALV